MKYDAKLWIKLALIFFGLLFFLCILLGRRGREHEAPKGEMIAAADVEILLQALGIDLSSLTALDGVTDHLTYAQYITICEALGESVPELPDYDGRYEPAHELLKADWYAAYQIMLAHLDTVSSIWETTVFLLKVDEAAQEAYAEHNENGAPYQYLSSAFADNTLRPLRVYVKGNTLLTVAETLEEEHKLSNVWVAESAEGSMKCFYHQILFTAEAEEMAAREQIADLTFRDGRVIRTKEKREKINGKLLRVSEEALEIEDGGVYPLAEGMEVYRLYGSMETLDRRDLHIGYADTDYVIEKGKVCACLVSRREQADQIRVLLKNTAENSNYYEAVQLTVDGETVRVKAQDLAVGERRVYRSAALTDKIILELDGITKEDNAYRGAIECYRDEAGMTLINELPLEEYLYAVVPSEMPASYPAESLKAQAVCARTYAYRYILHAGLPEAGAHVDDTTSYQVYHNIRENIASTMAVRETEGMLLTYRGEPAQNYYYSTSCGAGTDAGIWQSGSGEDISYIQGGRLGWDGYQSPAEEESAGTDEAADGAEDSAQTDVPTAEELRDEEKFRQFITSVDEGDLEYREPWYRWRYEVETIDIEALASRLRERYAASPASVLTQTEGDYFVSEPIAAFKRITALSITRRGVGGVAEELLIGTDAGTYKILSEYNIRYVLCDRKSSVVKQDQSSTTPGTLLPSGFFIIEAGKTEKNVVGYTLIGGGYGHGAGMSQNAAKALGEAGAPYGDILRFFFPACTLEEIQFERSGEV